MKIINEVSNLVQSSLSFNDIMNLKLSTLSEKDRNGENLTNDNVMISLLVKRIIEDFKQIRNKLSNHQQDQLIGCSGIYHYDKMTKNNKFKEKDQIRITCDSDYFYEDNKLENTNDSLLRIFHSLPQFDYFSQLEEIGKRFSSFSLPYDYKWIDLERRKALINISAAKQNGIKLGNHFSYLFGENSFLDAIQNNNSIAFLEKIEQGFNQYSIQNIFNPSKRYEYPEIQKRPSEFWQFFDEFFSSDLESKMDKSIKANNYEEVSKIKKCDFNSKDIFSVSYFQILKNSYAYLKYLHKANNHLNNFSSNSIISIIVKKSQSCQFYNLNDSINITIGKKNKKTVDRTNYLTLNTSNRTNDKSSSFYEDQVYCLHKYRKESLIENEEKFHNIISIDSSMNKVNNIDPLVKKNSKKHSDLSKSIQKLELTKNNLRKYLEDSSILNKQNQNSEYNLTKKIIKDQKYTKKMKDSYFENLSDLEEKSKQKLEAIKFEIINLIKYQNVITPQISKIIKNLKALLNLHKKNDKTLKFVQNISIHPKDLFNQIMNQLMDCKSSPLILRSLSHPFYIDAREIDLSKWNSDLEAFCTIIKMNPLIQYIIINQYDFRNLRLEGRTKALSEEVQRLIFKTIDQQEGFISFIFGIFN